MKKAELDGRRIASDYLAIDYVLAVDRLLKALREKVQQIHGIMLGFSGGLDSALLASIAVRACGSDKVYLYYLPDQFSSPLQHRHVEQLAEWLGAQLHQTSIELEMRKQGVYATAGMRLTSISASFNRILIFLFRTILRDSPFLASLKVGDAAAHGRPLKDLGLLQVIQQPEQGMNLRHRYRRSFLEHVAGQSGYALLGAANRTEWQTGWFVKDGVDDLPDQPLIGLYKTQVRDLGAYLNLPQAILHQAPSPDMLPGITDEIGLGLPYWKIDLILDSLSNGVSREQLAAGRITRKDVNHVQKLARLSAWKRASRDLIMPLDGGPESLLRMHPGAGSEPVGGHR